MEVPKCILRCTIKSTLRCTPWLHCQRDHQLQREKLSWPTWQPLWPTMSYYDPLCATMSHYYPPTFSTWHQGVKRKNDDISLNIDFSFSVLKEEWGCLAWWHYYFKKYWQLSFFFIILSFFGQKWTYFNFKIWHNDYYSEMLNKTILLFL